MPKLVKDVGKGIASLHRPKRQRVKIRKFQTVLPVPEVIQPQRVTIPSSLEGELLWDTPKTSPTILPPILPYLEVRDGEIKPGNLYYSEVELFADLTGEDTTSHTLTVEIPESEVVSVVEESSKTKSRRSTKRSTA